VIYNYTQNPLRRFDIDIGIGVGEDLSEVQKIGVSVSEAMKGVVSDPRPTMRNLGFGDSAMRVRFSGRVDQASADFLKVLSEAIRILKDALDNAGIDVPVPIQKVINVRAESLAPEPETPPEPEAELFKDARHADVDRESHLDEQIAKDRRTSREIDLLTEE
jgi:small conductance mechanosensitive channel